METSTNTKKSPYKVIKLGEENVVSYMPELKGVGALVDLKTLQRITGGLRKFKFDDIKEAFCNSLMGARDIEEYINMLGEELAFHTTCNKILLTDFDEAALATIRAEMDALTADDINVLKDRI